MSGSYTPGDITVNYLMLISDRGTTDLSSSFVAASIYESMFVPATVADIEVLDTTDILGTMVLSGDELVTFSYSVKGSDTATFVFFLHKLKDLHTAGAQKSKTYTLSCVSPEAFYAKINHVQKSYPSNLISDAVQDVLFNYMMSTKSINIEPTMGPQNILIPHKNPFEAISLLKKRAVSPTNKSSSYVFFENRQAGKQVYNFVTLESIFKANNIIGSYQQSDAILTNFFNNTTNNILAYSVPHQFSTTEKLQYGGPRKVTTFDFTTHEFITNIVNTFDTLFSTGGTPQQSVSSTFKSLFGNAKIPPQALIPVDTSQRALTNIPQGTPNFEAYLAVMVQNAIKIKVIGDTKLTAGTLINCTIPNKTGTTGIMMPDPLVSGTFMITRMRHRIGLFQEKPRYSCTMELIKGSYNQQVK